MKTSSLIPIIALAVLVGAAAVFYWPGSLDPISPAVSASADFSRPPDSKTTPQSASLPASSLRAAGGGVNERVGTPSTTAAAAPLQAAEQRIAALEAQIKSLQQAMRETAALPESLRGLQAQVTSLQQAMSGIDLEKAAVDRDALFSSEEGYLKVDEYAAAGQHAIAGEGYLTFLRRHPQHPDARDIMKKARDSFVKAGYKDKAYAVHDELMQHYPPPQQLAATAEMARLAKDAQDYGAAAKYQAQAAQMEPDTQERLWKRLYWAWYVQLEQGNAAGINALRHVQQEIAASGINNPKLNERAQQRMVEWQQQLARTGR